MPQIDQRATHPAASALLKATAEVTGIRAVILTGQSRSHSVAHARQIGMLAGDMLGMSSPEIGRMFGGRDHTTVLYGKSAAAKRGHTGIAQEIIDRVNEIRGNRIKLFAPAPKPAPVIPLTQKPAPRRRYIPPKPVTVEEIKRAANFKEIKPVPAKVAANEHRW